MVFGETVCTVNCYTVGKYIVKKFHFYIKCGLQATKLNEVFPKVFLFFHFPFYLQSGEVYAMKHIKNAELQDCMFW